MNETRKKYYTTENYVLTGNGFITIEVLREILRELDEKLTEDDLDNMVDEIDIDGSGTVDWEGTCNTKLKILRLTLYLFFRIQSCYDWLRLCSISIYHVSPSFIVIKFFTFKNKT
ncbi:hypothetical protein NQ314_007743 [Rhamnusium bicolor]|uniref:EF-hand domain-containing protein n=1 Tax=Rhamnusium bicolor TaxID=1586634 RepID=A0AAV8YH94_9CUCU|nr:hypothetical protein NQ314_007743 [Rhamnusium bicolor]